MTDQIITIRPSAESWNSKPGVYYAVGSNPAFTEAADVSDNSDGSWVVYSEANFLAGVGGLGFLFPSPAIPAGARVTSVAPRLRGSKVTPSGGGTGDNVIGTYLGDTNDAIDNLFQQYWADTFNLPTGANTTIGAGVWGRHPRTNADWDAGALSRLGLNLLFQPGLNNGDTFVTEVYLDVAYRRQGSVTVTPFPANKANTVKPTIKWAATAPDSPNAQAQFEIRVYATGVYSAGGFDPFDTSTYPPIYDSGIVSDSFLRAFTITDSLPQGQTFRAYVFVAQPWSGTESAGWWSYGYTEFSINAEKLAVPSVQAVADDIDASVTVSLLGAFNLMDAWGSGFETNPAADWELGPSSALFNAPVPGAGSTPDGWTVTTNGAGVARITRGPFVLSSAGVVVGLSVRSITATHSVELRLRWFDINGNFLGEYFALGGPTTATTTANVVIGPISFTSPPPGGVYATIVFQVNDAAAGHQFAIWSLAPNYYNSWAPVAGVQSIGGISPAKFSTPVRYGDHAMAVATASAGLCTVQTFIPIAVTPGVAYSMIASVATPSVYSGRPVQIFIFWYDAAHVGVGGVSSAIVTEIPGSWVDLVASGVAPPTAVGALMAIAITAASASELHLIDGVALHPNLIGGYGAGGWATAGITSTFGFECQRSLDGGVTWKGVRSDVITVDPKVQNNVLRDNEAPLGQVLKYRVRASAHSDSLGDATSDWSASSSVVVSATSARLKCPKRPELNMPIRLMAPFTPSRKFALGVFDNIIGRKDPVLIFDGQKGWEGSAKFRLQGRREHDAFSALLDSGEVLFLQDTVGRSWYLRPKSVTEDILRADDGVPNSPYPIGKVTDVEISFVSTSAPT